MIAVALLPAALVGGVGAHHAMEATAANGQAGLRREAQLHAGVVAQWLTDRRAQAQAWTQVFPNRADVWTDELRSGFLAAVYRGTPAAVVVVLVDADGRAVVPPVFATGPDAGGVDASRAQALIDRLPLTEAIASGSGLGAAFLPEGLGASPSLPIAVLAAGSGPDALVLGLELRVEPAEALAAVGRADHGVVLLDGQGTVIAGGGSAWVRPDLLRSLVGTDADFEYDVGGERVLGSVVPIPGSPWSAAVLEPAAVALGPVAAIRRDAVWAGLASAVLAVGVALVLAGTLTRPVERLRDAALELARGRRTPTDVDRGDEIGELARAFDHMATQLDEQRQAIERFNRELQQRVDARTRDLQAAQSELIRSEQLAAVAQVGAGLAHELNNPLSAVLGLAQVLRADRPDDPLLADLEASAARCRDVVGRMVRLNEGELDPGASVVVHLRDVCEDARRRVVGAFDQRGVSVRLGASSADPVRVQVDRGVATRIVSRLLLSMRSGLDAGASVSIDIREEHGDGVVWLQADRAMAGSADRRDDAMAAGLDVWVARQLADRHHGRVDAVDPTAWRVVLPGPT